MDFCFTMIDLLDQIVSTHEDAAVLLSAAIARLSEVFPTIPSNVKRVEILVSSIKNLLIDFENILKTYRPMGYERALHLPSLSSNCLKLIANSIQLLGSVNRGVSSQLELDLIKQREEFLKILSASSFNFTSTSCGSGDNECLDVANANQSKVQIEGGANSGGATVENEDDSEFVAISTFDFNPFPDLPNATEQLDESTGQEYLGVNTPVVGISLVSNNEAPGHKPSVAPNYDVVIPLKLNEDNKGTVVYLPPLCNSQTSFQTGFFVSKSLVNRICGPISIKLEVRSIIMASFDPTETVQKTDLKETIGYMLVKSDIKCRFPNQPCFRIHFVNSLRPPTCATTNDSCISGYFIVHTKELPRAVSSPGINKEDPFSIPLSQQFVKAIATTENTVFVLIEDLQPDPLSQIRVGSGKFRPVQHFYDFY